MFNSLKLTNFQVHKNLEVDFDRITTIVGPSDAGKSAIIRALRWLCLNEQIGDIQRHGSKNVSSQLKVGKHYIIRQRRSGKNSYKYDGNRYSAIRRDRPNVVVQCTNVSPINFQSQFDSPYWLSRTAGEVSRQLNSIIDLGVIDQALANVATELRKARSTHEVTSKRFEEAKEEVEELAWIAKCQADFDDLEVLHKRYLFKQQRMSGLRVLIESTQRIDSAQQNVGRRLGLAQAAYAAGDLALQKARKLRSLRHIVKRLEQIKLMQSIKLPKLDKLEALIERRTKLSNLISQLEDHEEESCEARKQLASSLKRLEKKLDGRCPVCGSKLRKRNT